MTKKEWNSSWGKEKKKRGSCALGDDDRSANYCPVEKGTLREAFPKGKIKEEGKAKTAEIKGAD